VKDRYLMFEFVLIIQLIHDKDIFVVHHLFHMMETDELVLKVMLMEFDHYIKMIYALEIHQHA
jgi:hypothetical protein